MFYITGQHDKGQLAKKREDMEVKFLRGKQGFDRLHGLSAVDFNRI